MTAAKVKVQVLGSIGKAVFIDPQATRGAQIGTDLRLPDGSVPTLEELAAALGVLAANGGATPGLASTLWRLIREIPNTPHSVIGTPGAVSGIPVAIAAAANGSVLTRQSDQVLFTTTPVWEGNHRWLDNFESQWGTDGDLSIFHTGAAGVIGNSTGPLGITALAGDLDLTASANVDILAGGDVRISADFVDLTNDNEELRIGAGQDLRLFHDGTTSTIRNDTGQLNVHSDAAMALTAVTNFSLAAGGTVSLGADGTISLLTNSNINLDPLGDLRLSGDPGATTEVLTSNGPGVPPTWEPGGGVTFADPTASVGLTAVNGVATTAMRSDAAPALSQAITPTWTGAHGFTGVVTISGSGNRLVITDTSGSGDARFVVGALSASDTDGRLLFKWDGVGHQAQCNSFRSGSFRPWQFTASQFELSISGTLGLAIDTARRVYGTALHNNGTLPTGTANQYIASGTYTPTASATSNLDAITPNAAQWLRVGNVVNVSGDVTIDPTVATATAFELSLPITSNFTATTQCAGAGAQNFSNSPAVLIRANATNDTAQFVFTAGGTSSQTLHYTYTYVIL